MVAGKGRERGSDVAVTNRECAWRESSAKPLSVKMGKSSKNLKSALLSHQSRLKAKEKISHAAKVAEEKSRKRGGISNQMYNALNPRFSGDSKGKRKAIAAPPKRRPTIPFRPTDKILLIGEGNFSFARALVESALADLQFLPPNNLTATSYDTEKQCYEKYPEAGSIISILRTKGVEVIFGVDGTRLEKHHVLRGRKWDRICWNFPHAGGY